MKQTRSFLPLQTESVEAQSREGFVRCRLPMTTAGGAMTAGRDATTTSHLRITPKRLVPRATFPLRSNEEDDDDHDGPEVFGAYPLGGIGLG